jgi:hypothetical protein
MIFTVNDIDLKESTTHLYNEAVKSSTMTPFDFIESSYFRIFPFLPGPSKVVIYSFKIKE